MLEMVAEMVSSGRDGGTDDSGEKTMMVGMRVIRQC